MKKIYIAGPDVFEQNSLEIAKKYKQICKDNNFEGLYPLDNVVDFNQEKHKIAQDIFVANEQLIKDSDIIVANLNPFRGKEADSGTIWECGYGYGIGKKVYGYMSNASSYADQFRDDEKELLDGEPVDKDGVYIENFNHPLNLMIACSAIKIIEGGFEDVIKLITKENY